MTRKKFEEKVKDEKLKMVSYDIVLDGLHTGTHLMGCVKVGDKWKIYKTNERDGHYYFLDEYDTEDAAFDDFYEYVKIQIKKEHL
jgi:hypothetical protein